MPIEVHCPNPVCARVHVVKNRYAGMRGRCPACNAWMYVPASVGMPSMREPRPMDRTETIDWSAENRPAVVEQESYDQPFDEPLSRRSRKQEKPAVRLEAAESAFEVDEPAPQPRRFSWMGALCLLLGSLGMGAVAASPYLEAGPPTKTPAIDAGLGIYASVVPGVVAGLTFLFFLGGIVRRRLGFLTIGLLYLATIFSAAVLFLGLHELLPEMAYSQKLYAATGGAAAACAFYLLAALFIHRRWLPRLFTLVVLGTVVAAVPIYFYRGALGLGDTIPEIDLGQVLKSMGL